MKVKRLFLLIGIIGIFLLSGCQGETQKQALNLSQEDTIYQVATIQALLEGNYDGLVAFSDLKKLGDVGIGTFDKLDGEMIMIDNRVYQAKYDGTVVEVEDTEKTPFSVVTTFNEDAVIELGPVSGLDDLKEQLDEMIVSKDLFYVFQVDGNFNSVQVRSVPEQEKPYPVLSEVVKEQSVFDYQNMPGTIIGFWCPDNVGGINVAGYHFHFIADDRSKAGHLLDISFSEAEAMMDSSNGFSMAVFETDSSGALEDVQEAVDSVE